jgi:hypothetical protein
MLLSLAQEKAVTLPKALLYELGGGVVGLGRGELQSPRPGHGGNRRGVGVGRVCAGIMAAMLIAAIHSNK